MTPSGLPDPTVTLDNLFSDVEILEQDRDTQEAPAPSAAEPHQTLVDYPRPQLRFLPAPRVLQPEAQEWVDVDMSDGLPMEGETFGHYEVIRTLGRGGMGVVYLARDIKLGRKVAIKFLTEIDRGLTLRFTQEACATAQCTHPNIVAIHEVSEYNERPFMVLEYLEGTTLRNLIRQGPMSPQRAVSLGVQIARALVRAHSMGIVHRDLKPENIMLTDTGIVKVLDFGIVKILEQKKEIQPSGCGFQKVTTPFNTQCDRVIGTLPYMSPEQLGHGQTGHRTDLWALGILMAEMVMGKHPFLPYTDIKLLELTSYDCPSTSIHALAPEIGELGNIVDRCLIKNPARRIPDAQAVLDALETIQAKPTTTDTRQSERPFVGLAAFQECDAGRFFGRDEEIATLVERLRYTPLITVVGASGIGKSSVVRAGVIPALKQSDEGWETLIIRPGRLPLLRLVGLLAELTTPATTDKNWAADTLEPHYSEVWQVRQEPGYLAAQLRSWATEHNRRILIFIDQLEELFTLTEDPEDRAQFMACLASIADDATSPLRVIAAIRADFVDRLAEGHRFSMHLSQGITVLPPMPHDRLKLAYEQTVKAVGYQFETDKLIELMIKDAHNGLTSLPLLQFTARQLWDLRDTQERMLTFQSYRRIGGVAGALATHADAVLSSFPSSKQPLVRALLQRLVTPQHTRDVVRIGDLSTLPGKSSELTTIIHDLARARLLSVESQSTMDDSTVEIAHESLITRWPTLRRWLMEDQNETEFLAQLCNAAHQWEEGEYDPNLLWKNDAALKALEWRKRQKKRLGPREEKFIAAVLVRAQQARRRSQARKLVMLAVLIVITCAIVVVAAVSIAPAKKGARASPRSTAHTPQTSISMPSA